MTDAELLREYVRTRSPTAFAEVWRRHVDWVYCAARRLVGDAALAEDVTQAVFIVLSTKADKIVPGTLGGWLLKVTRYCSMQTRRARSRRERHERQAALNIPAVSPDSTDDSFSRLSDRLDETVCRLGSSDRQVVMLRFYRQKSMAELAETIGISEPAAKKRVARALVRLRNLLGETAPTSADALGVILLSHTTIGAPASLTFTAGADAHFLAQGAITMIKRAKIKFAAALIAGAAIPIAVATMLILTTTQPGTPLANAAPPAPSTQPLPQPAPPVMGMTVNIGNPAAKVYLPYEPRSPAVLRVRAADIDGDALAQWWKTMQADPALAAVVGLSSTAQMSAQIESAQKFLADFHAAGGTTFYSIQSMRRLMTLHGMIYVPLTNFDNAAKFWALFRPDLDQSAIGTTQPFTPRVPTTRLTIMVGDKPQEISLNGMSFGLTIPPQPPLGPMLDHVMGPLSFDQTPIHTAIAQWAKAAGVMVTIDWDALTEAGVDNQTKITMSTQQTNMADALVGILEQAAPGQMGCLWNEEGPQVTITTPLLAQEGWEKRDSGTKPDLDEALATESAPIRLALSQQIPGTLLDQLIFSGPNRNPASEGQWQGVTSAAIDLYPPPNESLQLIFNCKSPEAATALCNMLETRLADESPKIYIRVLVGTEFPKLEAALAPQATGNRVVMTADKQTVDEILLPLTLRLMTIYSKLPARR